MYFLEINWKLRLKNPQFWINVGVSTFGIVTAYLGVNVNDLTSWKSVFDLLVEAIKNPVIVVSILGCIWNAINDPTTKGIADSKEALSYNEPKK